jgi:hypothetical protein
LNKQQLNKPLWVIDTNVVLDLLHFDDVAARPLRLALEDGRVRCVVSDSTLAEWRRVLAYPEFGLDSAQQATLFARYEALADTVGGKPHGCRRGGVVCRVAATPTTSSLSNWPPPLAHRG